MSQLGSISPSKRTPCCMYFLVVLVLVCVDGDVMLFMCEFAYYMVG